MAHTVAVATPCWPAPVSAMMRRLPMRCASSPWPTALLILCAPVCARSSRLSQTGPAPTRAANRAASWSGVGRPTYVLSRRRSSAWNASSAMAARKPASNSSRAGMIVSGTYCPPYGPKRPRAAAEGLVGALIIAADCLQKSSDETWILAAIGELDAATHVDAQRLQCGQRVDNVVRLQSAGDEAARTDSTQSAPIEGASGAARQRLGVGIEQVAVCAERIGGHDFGGGGLMASLDVERLEGRARHGGNHIGGLFAG